VLLSTVLQDERGRLKIGFVLFFFFFCGAGLVRCRSRSHNQVPSGKSGDTKRFCFSFFTPGKSLSCVEELRGGENAQSPSFGSYFFIFMLPSTCNCRVWSTSEDTNGCARIHYILCTGCRDTEVKVGQGVRASLSAGGALPRCSTSSESRRRITSERGVKRALA
jgi:hypothetical protein